MAKQESLLSKIEEWVKEMKCPNCGAPRERRETVCSQCGATYTSEDLLAFRQLEFLLAETDGWVERLPADLIEELRQPYVKRLADLRARLIPAPTPPPPAAAEPEAAPVPPVAPVVARPAEEIAGELALVEATLEQVQSWVEATAIGFTSAINLRQYLTARADGLKAELAGRPVEIEPPSDLAVLDFALESLPQWARDRHIGSDDSESLRNHLTQERTALLRPEPAPPAPTPVAAPAPAPRPIVTPPPAPKPAPPPPKPPAPAFDWAKWWERAWSFVVSGALLRGLLYLGAFMIVVSAAVLVVVYWRVFPLVLQLGFMAAVPLTFYLSGFVLRTRLELPVAGGVFTGIGALLVAVDFAAVYQFGGLAGRVDVNAYWLMASVFCTVVYAITAWRLPIEFYGYITLIGVSSTLLALTRVLGLPLEWQIASLTALAVPMVESAARLERAPDRWDELAQAARRLPQILIPVSLAAVVFVPGKASLGQTGACVFASLGYGLLAWRFPAVIFAHATVWSSILAVGFALRAAALPWEWYATAAVLLAPPYILAGRLMGRQIREDFAPRRGYVVAVYGAGFGLVGIAVAGGMAAVVFNHLWAGVLALTLAVLVLAWCGYLFRRPILVFIASGLFIVPFSLAIAQWLGDFNVPQSGAWLMGAWAGLALVYLGLAVLLRAAERVGMWLNLWAHLLATGALLGLLLNYGITVDAWFASPTVAALGGVILLYLASALIHDSGRHPALSNYVTWLPARIERPIFLWPVGFLLPVWLAVAWSGSALDWPWLGAALAGLALAYVVLGQLLARRKAEYRLPPHVYVYALAVVGIRTASGEAWPMLTSLYIVVGVLAALALVYRRVGETALAALLFIWPFQLSLEVSPLTPHAYSLAYALLASLGYIPLGIALDRAGRKYALPAYVIGYALSAYAVGTSLLGRFGVYPLDVPWMGVAVSLIVTGLQVFSLYRFRHFSFAWAAALVFPIAFGQTLRLMRVPPEYDAAAWVGLAYASLLTERALARTVLDRPLSLGQRTKGTVQCRTLAGRAAWWRAFRPPLGVGAVALCALGLWLTMYGTTVVFTGGQVENYFPLILAQTLAVGLAVLAAWLYRSRWPLYLEPWLAFFPLTLFFTGYGPRLFGQALTTPQYGIVWSAAGLAHLLAGALLDRSKARYAQGLYLGGYAMVASAILWTLTEHSVLVWTLGLGIVAAAGSSALVHFNRHRTWDEVVNLFFGSAESPARSAFRGAFLWFAAWPFPVWCVLLLRELDVGNFDWLGFGVPALLFLGLALWLRRLEPTYAWPLHTAAQFYTLAGLIISAPLTTRFLAGGYDLPAETRAASAFILLQALALVFYAASARVFRWRFFAHLAAWLSFFPYTLMWILYGPELSSVQFAWVWTGLAAMLLGVGFALDRARGVRYAHGPYLAGYVLGGFALVWSVPDRLANLYTLGAAIVLALASHALVHYGRHYSFDDFIRFIWRRGDTIAQRAARTGFLFFAAYAFPVWLVQLMAYHDVPLAWRGLALALTAPIYIALGLAARRVKREYTWPLYSAGYALTAIGAMLTIDNEQLAIYVLALDALVFAISAYVFRQAFWLYLSNTLVPVVALLTLHYNQALNAPWVAGTFMALAFLYFGIGQWLDRMRPEDAPSGGIVPFALPFYAPGYLLSAVALAVASREQFLALVVYSAGVVLYALSAWAFRESLFLYPAAWLAAVPYYLAMTLTPLPPLWYGLGWLPLVVGYIALGRFVFQKAPLGVKNLQTFFAALTHPAMPFYLLAYALSVNMMVLSRPDPLTLTLAFAAGGAVYFASAALFRHPAWLYPGLAAAHLALMTTFTIRPTGRPAYYISLPFLGMTWAMALAGYWFSRRFPVAQQTETGKLVFPGLSALTRQFRRWGLDFGSLPSLRYLVTPSWAQPFFLFAAFDLVFWQVIALRSFETAVILAIGHAILLGLFAMLWQDTALAYGTLVYSLLAVGYRLRWDGVPFADAMAWVGGIGLGLYLLAWIAERVATGVRPRVSPLAVWPKPLTNAAIFLTTLALLATLPTVATRTTAAAAGLAFAGALYLAIAYRGRHYPLGYLGMGMLVLAWALALIVRDVRQPQLYAIPAGLYLTGIGFLERRLARRPFASLVESFGLAVLLTTSFIQSLDSAGGFPYFLLLLVEALLVIWWGAARRIKVPFFIGLGVSALNVVAQVVVLINVYDVNRFLVIFGVGLLLVTVAMFVERQRARIIARTQEWFEVLETWE